MTEGKQTSCVLLQKLVLKYIAASPEERAAFDQNAVEQTFYHIYWCLGAKCGQLWYLLRSKNNSLRPNIQNGIDEEIVKLITRWIGTKPPWTITLI